MDERWQIRMLLIALLVASGAFLGHARATDDTRQDVHRYFDSAAKPIAERQPLVDERPNATVVATRAGRDYPGSDALYVVAPSGRLLYLENRTRYADVDPSPAGEHTLLVAADTPTTAACEGRCSDQMIRRINYSTGATTDLYRINTPKDRASNWHDVDRVGPHRYAVAGIWHDNAWVINVSSGVREWHWSMQSEFNISSGGPYPSDWAHMNDIERLPDGRYMLSPRNHDQVLFVHPERGLQESWTVGRDDDFDTLYEQHNPDYIPASRGGPAVLIADSENNRIVEYQRVNGSWQRSWVWQDERMDWPRDADRLPNGHTLITDTHANRVIEVNEQGEIVWTMHVPYGYDAERLGTGDESAGGWSAAALGLKNRTSAATSATNTSLANEGDWTRWNKLWHGVQFVLPPWMGVLELLFAIEFVAIWLVWAGIELYWRGVRIQRPVEVVG